MSHFKAYSANPGGVSTIAPVYLGASATLGNIAVNASAFGKFEADLDHQLDAMVQHWAAWSTPEGEYHEIRQIVKQRGRKHQ